MRTPAASRRHNESPTEMFPQIPTVSEIQEEHMHQQENIPPEKIYVAVGKDMEESVHALRWALQNLDNLCLATIILFHIRVTVRYIPSPMGKFPVNETNKHKVADYIKEDENEINNCMKEYFQICSRAKVKAEILVLEKIEVLKGIVEAISELGIRKLIIGTTSVGGSFSKKMRGNGKADYVQKHTPESCKISIVCKGKLVTVSGGSPVSPPLSVQKMKSYRRPLSNWFRKSPETPRVPDSSLKTQHPTSLTPYFPQQLGASLPAGPVSSVIDCNSTWPEEVNTSDSEDITTQGIYSESDDAESTKLHTDEPFSPTNTEIHALELSEEVNTEIETLKFQLREALQAAEERERQMQIETEKRKKAMKKFKDCEAALKEAAKEKEDLRSQLRLTEQKYEEITKQKDEALQELQTMAEALRSLESKVNEISWQRHEKIQELEAACSKLAAMEAENCRILRERNAAIKQIGTPISSSSNIQFTEHSFDDIVAATCNFDDHFRLGEGGYGTVFKGELNATTVAIKILKDDSLQGRQEFQQEIDMLRNVRHPHLVRIVGACFEKCCIVYEYMSNGSLQDRLFCNNATPPLPWHARFRIASEVCSALQFLHTSNPNSIVHRDLKPANILLDENLASKIGDFGLARPIRDNLFTETLPKGTFCYMDPEYLTSGVLTPKSDVYSLGVVILQLLTGKPPRGLVKLVETALNCGHMKMLLDPSAGEWPLVQATQLADLSLRCTNQNRNNRPDLHPTVMNILERLRTFAVEASNPTARAIEDIPIPGFFLCPIFKEVMHDPYVAADGFTYEMEGIKGWLDSGHDWSPVTKVKFEHKNLIPNHSLESAIRQWQEKRISHRRGVAYREW